MREREKEANFSIHFNFVFYRFQSIENLVNVLDACFRIDAAAAT